MLIHEFQKNALEKIRVSTEEFKGKEFLDIRVYYDASSGKQSDWKPSKKGIALSFDKLPELKKGIDKAFKECEKNS